jgi:ribosomal protein L17
MEINVEHLKAVVRNVVSDSIKEDKLKKIDDKKEMLKQKVNKLVAFKKQNYGKMDISSPMSKEEKDLDKEIAGIYSEINQLIIEKRNIG